MIKAMLMGLFILTGFVCSGVSQAFPGGDMGVPINHGQGHHHWPGQNADKDRAHRDRQARREERRQRLQNMSPEERQALREKRRAHFQSLPPEQQQRIRERRQARRAKRQHESRDGQNN